jgi:hypothetical protein
VVTYIATNQDGEQSLTVFGTDWQKPVAGTHPNFATLATYLLTTPQTEHDEEYVRGLVDPAVGIGRLLQAEFGDRITFDMHHFYIDGIPEASALGRVVAGKVIAGNENWLRFVRFLDRLQANPSKSAKDAIWEWVDKHGASITDDGRIVGYKGLVNGKDAVTGERDVPVSYHSGPNNFIDGVLYGEAGVAYQVPHRIGSVISKRRADVDDNNRLACSTGLHVGAYSYAKTFGENRADGARYSTMGRMADSLPNSTFALVIFAPEDVVSVPADGTSDWKIRVAKYEISEFLDEVKDILKDKPIYDVKVSAPFLPAGQQVSTDGVIPEDERVQPEPEEIEDTVEPEDDEDVAVEVEMIPARTPATLADLVKVHPDLLADLNNPSLGHKPLARKWSTITTESSVRRFRKAAGIKTTLRAKVSG